MINLRAAQVYQMGGCFSFLGMLSIYLMKIKYLVVLIVVILLVLAYLSRDQLRQLLSGNPSQPSPATTLTPTTTPGEASSSTPVSENMVTLTSTGFQPAKLTVKTGTVVTFVNKSGAMATVNSNPHPTHENYQLLNLGRFSDGGTLSLTFNKPGSFGYHNHLNSSQTGTIIVE